MPPSWRTPVCCKIAWVRTGGQNLWGIVCCSIPHNSRSELTDAAAQRFACRQLRLASATNDMDGFVEVELDHRQGPRFG
jgi:hypothetical protein